MQVKLKVLGGAHSGKEILVKDEKFFIGRSDSCQLRPKSDSISRKHCAILQRDGKVIVADLKSRNGTYLNETQLEPEKAKVLASGDVLRVGQLEFEVLIEHGLGGAKKPEVADLRDAATRLAAEQAGAKAASNDSFSVADWLIEADLIDRTHRGLRTAEPETKMIAMDETSQIDLNSEDTAAKIEKPEGDSGVNKRVDKGPMKLPKQKMGPATQNSRVAAKKRSRSFLAAANFL